MSKNADQSEYWRGTPLCPKCGMELRAGGGLTAWEIKEQIEKQMDREGSTCLECGRTMRLDEGEME